MSIAKTHPEPRHCRCCSHTWFSCDNRVFSCWSKATISSIMEMTMEKSTSFAAEGRGEKTHARRARSTAENNASSARELCLVVLHLHQRWAWQGFLEQFEPVDVVQQLGDSNGINSSTRSVFQFQRGFLGTSWSSRAGPQRPGTRHLAGRQLKLCKFAIVLRGKCDIVLNKFSMVLVMNEISSVFAFTDTSCFVLRSNFSFLIAVRSPATSSVSCFKM